MFADGDHRVRFGLDSGHVAENQVQNVGADSEDFGLGNLVLELVVKLVPVALLVDQHIPDVFGILGGLHDPVGQLAAPGAEFNEDMVVLKQEP